MAQSEGPNEESSDWRGTLLVILGLLVAAFLLTIAVPVLVLLARELSCR